ncbi:hypothetical protein VPH35_133674 [Triticum aestivum]
MPAMEGLIKLFNMWEIQLLVLLSFTLQIFLFFTGSLRQHSTNMFLRISIWGAYLGADFVAVYTLGLVSRHEDITIERLLPGKSQPLAFFWAPFLLIHLGGQDTITAFAMEDNNLWLRHFLNLVVQVVLAIYVFWKSIGRHRVELLVSGVFVVVVGVIKYGERIWSLKCGCFKSLEMSGGQRYKKLSGLERKVSTAGGYDRIVCTALGSMPRVHDIFSGRGLFYGERFSSSSMLDDPKQAIKTVSIFLSVMYADLYTKALVVRTRNGIISRRISQMSAVVAFAVFHANDKQRYIKVDIAITYSLFVGGFFLEACAMLISMTSPWTWAWLKVRNWDKLAKLSWFIFSSDIGWPEEKQLWTKSMGQYNLVSWITGSGQARTFKQRVMMTMVKWFANLVGAERKKIFWISKLLDTEYVDVGETTMECVVEEIRRLRDEGYIQFSKEWANFFGTIADFGASIVLLHALTEKHLSKHPTSGEVGMMEVCRKLSNYMMYLLATQPSMLPLNVSAGAVLDELQDANSTSVTEGAQAIEGLTEAAETDFELTREVLEVDLVHVWARLLIYAAGKTRGEMHMAQLSRGGELITLVWLLMSLHELGDSEETKIRLTKLQPRGGLWVQEIYAFPVPAATGPEEAT